nr:helix-turn-helix domain-containing protein [uncultured Lacibacter sp.]
MEKHEQLPEPSISLDEPMYDKQDILLHFHISERTLATWRKNGIIPFLKMGGKIYYPKKLVEAQLEKYRRRV